MQSHSLYLNLLLPFMLVRFSSGMNPESPTAIRYSDQERELMFKMLESEIQLGPYQPSWWTNIEQAFEEKRKANVNGFSNRRSIKSLRQHFLCTLKNDKVDVPDALRGLHKLITKTPFTRAEQDFINTELLQSADDLLGLYSVQRWRDIQKKHEEKLAAGTPGFANKRSWRVLLHHFRNVMKPRNLVTDAVKQKFPDNFEPEQDLSLLDELLNEIDDPRESYIGYTVQEDELMFKMLESQAASHKPFAYKDIQAAFEEKIKDRAKGFSKRRSLRSLQRHLLRTLRGNKNLVPDAVREVYEHLKRMRITPQEQDFINTELLRSDLPSSWTLNSHDRWKKMEEKHDEKRESGTLGFSNKRIWISLKNHFYYVMKTKNLVDEAVKKRFPHDFENNQGPTSIEEDQPNIDQGVNMECNEEDEVWDPILEDLENTQRGPIDDYGVDHTMFLDTVRQDNDIYTKHSPYDIRTFEIEH